MWCSHPYLFPSILSHIKTFDSRLYIFSTDLNVLHSSLKFLYIIFILIVLPSKLNHKYYSNPNSIICKILFVFTMLYHDSLILNWFPWIVYSYTVGEVRFDVNRDSFVQCILVTAKVKQ